MTSDCQPRARRRLDLRGQVQGVGFRPFVYRLAGRFSLAGYVANNSNGAVIEIEGPSNQLDIFERDLVNQLPPLAKVAEMSRCELAVQGESGFRIETSATSADRRPEVTPDAATCADCLRELRDPADQRYRYPFINCTNCGPRYSIIRTVPYDRPATTMAVFQMCPPCQTEYTDPADRRFHAQPNACSRCGPHLQLVRYEPSATGPCKTDIAGDAIVETANLLRAGRIVAIKGVGGYHLACRADLPETVQHLRARKLRDGKPLAVMVPDLDAARRICHLSATDEEALSSPAAPIVLATQCQNHGLALEIAPGCDTFGVLLPYTPLHHLLFDEGLGPLVMTSANLAGHPLTYRDTDAFDELADVAEAFLIHNREIYRPIDDSVVFTFRESIAPIRRARGYAPRPIRLAAFSDEGPLASLRDQHILAVGAELKSTICLLTAGEAILSEHLGDLSNPAAYRHFVDAIDRLKELYDFTPNLVAHDLHPRYLSTQYAAALGIETIAVQHHHAHIASVLAEHNEASPVIGLSCDGTGYGTDGAVWGCEVLRCDRGEFSRLGHLEYFPLVGGDAAAVETWRPAAALLRASRGHDWLAAMPPDHGIATADLNIFEQQVAAQFNTPPTSSLGRVFDAVSFLLGLCQRNRHEAEAALALEAAADNETVEPYPYEVVTHVDGLRLAIGATIRAIVADLQANQPIGRIAARFHETIAQMLTTTAIQAGSGVDIQTVAISGGCFANRRLLQRLVELLEANGQRVLYHREVPSGDGGIALGQALIAAWRLNKAD
ncbi:MAG: carbamoyltransferase HypF [Planctomycetota bacterium]